MVHEEFYTLSNGVRIPKIALGTWQTKDGEECYNSVKWALEAGYRHIDTANAYGNEESVGKAVKDSGIPREEIFITTKIPAEIKTYDGALAAFNDSMAKLDLGYIDLILIHAPWPWSHIGMDCTEGNIEVWKLLVSLYEKGVVRSIGVSNFHDYNIKPIVEATGVMPMVNQIRYFIGNTQNAIVEYCDANNILVEAYSPLATGNLVNDETLAKIAKKYNTSIPKICIRYCIQKNTLPLPKSVHEHRIKDNLDINFVISDEDMRYLDSLKEIGPTRPLRT